MSEIPQQTLVDAVNDIVRPTIRRGELHTLTHKLVRLKVEKKLGLAEGTASSPEYTVIIKEATENAINEGSVEASKPEGLVSANKTRESEGTVKSGAGLNNGSSSSASASKRKRISHTESPPSKKPARTKSKQPEAKQASEDDSSSGESNEESEGHLSKKAHPKTKAKSSVMATRKTVPMKHRISSASKGRKSTSRQDGDEHIDVDKETEEDQEPTRPIKSKVVQNSSTTKATSTATKQQSKPTKPKGTAQFKSAEHVPLSDMEQDESSVSVSQEPPNVTQKAKRLLSKPAPPVIALSEAESHLPPSKWRKKVISANIDEEEKETETEVQELVNKPGSFPTAKKVEGGVDNGDDSETGLSDLIDEPPKRRKQTKSTENTTKAKAKASRKASSSKPALSKDEQTIKRLKSFVLACGVRKVWAKLFKDLDPKAQIAKLKEILADLGMSGRYTMEKAKEIKEKREIEKELEDVQEFAKSMQERESRRKGKKVQVEEGESNDESEEEEVVLPRRRVGNARNSIAAFLQEQSDSE